MVIKLMLSGDNISVGVIKSRCVAVEKVVPFGGQFNSWVMGGAVWFSHNLSFYALYRIL